jgi:hypothetical protein
MARRKNFKEWGQTVKRVKREVHLWKRARNRGILWADLAAVFQIGHGADDPKRLGEAKRKRKCGTFLRILYEGTGAR